MNPALESSTILVVANDAAKADRLTPVLAAEGYQIETVLSFSLPLPRLETRPDLGIIWFPYASPDALPELETIIKAIQALGQTAPLQILLIIDQDGTRWVEPSFRLGITDILTRPIHPLVLRQRVRLLLKAHQTEELNQQLRQRIENQERQRMINALESALHMFREEPVSASEFSASHQAPFSIHSCLQFDPQQQCLIFQVGNLADCRKVDLTTDQSAILMYMICHPYRALSNREIAQAALGYAQLDEIQSRSIVRPHILRLRRKLEEDPEQPEILRTIRGSGYVFSPV